MFFIHFAATTLPLTATSCSAALPARGGGPGGRGRACRSRLPARTCRSTGGGASCAPAAVAAPEQSGRRFWVRMMMKKTRVPPHHHHLSTHPPPKLTTPPSAAFVRLPPGTADALFIKSQTCRGWLASRCGGGLSPPLPKMRQRGGCGEY